MFIAILKKNLTCPYAELGESSPQPSTLFP